VASALFNRVNVPPGVLGSVLYNERPVPLAIEGVRRSHSRLFEALGELAERKERVDYFQGYMDVAFSLHQWRDEEVKRARLAIKNSYVRFLLGWIFDSNSREGAVLKSWVESRFGLAPTFHKEPLGERDCPAYFSYMKEMAKGLGATNAIYEQLDLLYEFIQAELLALHGDAAHITLFRGVHDFDEHRILSVDGGTRYKIRLNNLNSFTRDVERAWEFGTRVMEVRVPTPKVFFDGALLHGALLQGEEEVLVIGGDYEIKLRWY